MLPTSVVAKNVLEIASLAELQAHALQEKYNIKTINMIKDRDYLEEERPLFDPLIQYLNQFELLELKKLNVMVMVGDQPSRLQGGSRSLRDVFLDLEHTFPEEGDKQSYIAFFKQKIFQLPALLTESFNVCREHSIDPDEELAEI